MDDRRNLYRTAQFLNKIHSIIEYIAVMLFCIIGLVVSLQIVVRFTDLTITSLPVLSQVLFVAMSVLGVPYAIKTKDHLSIRSVFEYLPEKISNSLILISDVSVLLFCLVMSYSSFLISIRRINSSIPTLGWLKWGYIDAVIGIAFLISVLFLIERVITEVRSIYG